MNTLSKKVNRRHAALLSAASLFALAISGSSIAATNLCPSGVTCGAGSTFVQPAFAALITLGNFTNTVEYNQPPFSTGSGAGATQFINFQTAFGDGDVGLELLSTIPPFDNDLDAANATGFKVAQIPVATGAVSIMYNANCTTNPLVLTATQVDEIFSHTKTTWDQIDTSCAMNQPIVTVGRTGVSGTNFTFTTYLSQQDSNWLATPNQEPLCSTVTVQSNCYDIRASGNSGVAGVIRGTSTTPPTAGAVGGVELAGASSPFATLVNNQSQPVVPSSQSTTLAASGFTLPLGTKCLGSTCVFPSSFVNSPTPGSYPIVGVTYTYVWNNSGSALVSGGGLTPPDAHSVIKKQLKSFLLFVLANQQAITASPLLYGQLPPSILKAATNAVNALH